MLHEGLALANTAYQLYRDKVTQRREDTAYQRATYDMRQAGLNPILHGVSPAQSSPGPQDTGVNSALQQRLLSSQIALQNSQALASAVTSARELATTFKEAGINIGSFNLGGKINSRNNSAMVEYMNSMLGAVGLSKLKFRGHAVPAPQAPSTPAPTKKSIPVYVSPLAPASAKEEAIVTAPPLVNGVTRVTPPIYPPFMRKK